MRVQDIKTKLTLSIPVDKPDCNGIVYTKEAVENAISKLRTNLPILYQDKECDAKVIGTTTGLQHIVVWDAEKQVYKVTLDGVVFYGGAYIRVHDIEDGKISSFDIESIGVTIR